MRSLLHLRTVLTLFTLLLLSAWLEARNLEVWTGNRKREVEASTHAGTVYYRVKDLARAFNLELQEGRGRLKVSGSRGRLELVAGRPLVAVGEQYTLLAADVMLHGRGDWWVPTDFLDKALPGLIDQRIERTGPDTVRLRSLRENRVRLQVFTYPDHLSLVFDSSQQVPAEVRDFRDHIDVTYREFLTEPELMAVPAAKDLIAGVHFLPEEGLGTFRLEKGIGFRTFRDYRLTDPPRLVLEVYGTRREPAGAVPAADQPTAPPVISRESSPVPLPSPGVAADVPAAPVLPGGGVVIDPGHGGDESGAGMGTEPQEKSLALELSLRIEKLLSARGQPTHLTRSRDVALALEQRSAVANYYRPSAYVGVHLGGAYSPSLRGAIVYVHSPLPTISSAPAGDPSEEPALARWDEAQGPYLSRSRRLATLLQERLNQLYQVENPVLALPLASLASIEAPAVIVEAGFLTSPEDRELLASPEFLDRLARTVAEALIQFGSE